MIGNKLKEFKNEKMEHLHWRLHFLKIKNKCFKEEEEQKEIEIIKNKGKTCILEKKK